MSSGCSTTRRTRFFIVVLAISITRSVLVESYSTKQYEHSIAAKEVVALNKENFQKAISSDPANSFWFLKFFAPW